MNLQTVQKLIALNHQFYQTFAAQFTATRQRLQPGVQRILMHLDSQANILDLGCGNGKLARQLCRGGHRGLYVGLDFSPALLAVARGAVRRDAISPHPERDSISPYTFLQADLSTPDWDRTLSEYLRGSQPEIRDPKFEIALAFAVLHHLPGMELRRQALNKVHGLLAPHGRLIHSEWQFLNSPRLRARIQPWERVGLSQSEVDDGDYLLDWRHGGLGLRYVHHFTLEELDALAEEAGFGVLETFFSDGEEGRLGLYQVWRPE